MDRIQAKGRVETLIRSLEMWPGITTDVKTLIPAADRVRKHFGICCFCVVADQGMISAETIK